MMKMESAYLFLCSITGRRSSKIGGARRRRCMQMHVIDRRTKSYFEAVLCTPSLPLQLDCRQLEQKGRVYEEACKGDLTEQRRRKK